MLNTNLASAKLAKNDEFYTQYPDIQKEIEAYLDYDSNAFTDKVVYCNCDDPFESNFFRYFTLNFKRLGLKQLITTSYKPSPIDETQLVLTGIVEPDTKKIKGRNKTQAKRFIINDVGDFDGDGAFNNNDIAKQLKANKNNEWKTLKGDRIYPAGDFRSTECVELLKQSDIVVTNPPFSLFRDYVSQLIEYNKKFVIIGSMNAITYKEIFPLIKDDNMWFGNGFHAGNAYFATPNIREFASGVYDTNTGLVKFRNVVWFTNLDHGKRHRQLSLMTMDDNRKFNKKIIKSETAYKKYDNYDAIEVPFTDAIPNDFKGVMAVPISFLEKYSPEQFKILGVTQRNDDPYKVRKYTIADYPNANDLNARGVVMIENKPKAMYARILIQHREATA